MSALQQAVEGYFETLERFTAALRAAEKELGQLRSRSQAVERELSKVGRILSFQEDSPGTDHALSMLAWAVKTTCSTLDLSLRSFDAAKAALPHLDVRVRTLKELATALRMAAGTAVAPIAARAQDPR